MFRWESLYGGTLLLLVFSGDLSGPEGISAIPEIIRAVKGQASARYARQSDLPLPLSPRQIEINLSDVSALGRNGADLLAGIYRLTAVPLVITPCLWSKTVRLLFRGAM